MKKIYTLFLALIITGSLMAQTPQSFKYQAVVRNSSEEIIADQLVGLQLSILQGSTSGTAVYVETHTPTTNGFGLINLEIGDGTVVSGDFTTIDWGSDSYFIKIEIDATGGTSYTAMGTSQLLSVPYALHAKTVKSITETDPVFGAHTAYGIGSTDLTNWNAAYGWDDHSLAGYLTSYTETDPVFGTHAANGITSTNITNWTTAYGWGDHSLAGYLTSFSETDPQVGSNTINYIPKWDGSALVSGTIYDNGTNVGIGTTNPGSKLHIRLSGTTILDGFRLQTSQTTGEDWYIYMPSTDDLVFRNDVTDVVTIAKNTGNVGIGGDPGGDEKLWVTTDGTDISGIYVDHNKTGSGYAYGIYVDVDATYSGNKYAYGISSNALNNGGSYSTYGLRGYATGTSTGTKYGVYGFTGGTGTRYGVYASGDLAYTGSLIHISDVKFKKNVQSMTGILPKLKQLNAKSYTHSTDSKYKHMNLTKGNHYGLIAQELEQVFPELVIDAVHPGEQDEETGEFIGEEIHYKGVKYMELIPILVQAIQEQQQMIENLQQEIENLKNK